MEKNEMLDIHNIIMNTLMVVPKAFDMDNDKFNCDCHLELTERTYQIIGERFNVDVSSAKQIVDNYFIATNGYV